MSQATILMASDLVHARLIKLYCGLVDVAIYRHHVYIFRLNVEAMYYITGSEIKIDFTSNRNVHLCRLELPHLRYGKYLVSMNIQLYHLWFCVSFIIGQTGREVVVFSPCVQDRKNEQGQSNPGNDDYFFFSAVK